MVFILALVSIELSTFVQLPPDTMAATFEAGPRVVNISEPNHLQDETITIEHQVRVPAPLELEDTLEFAPSISLKQNQTYNVRWQAPNEKGWYISISKPGSDTLSPNSWEEYHTWSAKSPTDPRTIVARDLGTNAKCLVTVWYVTPVEHRKGSTFPLAVPYVKSTQSIRRENNRKVQEFIFEFTHPDQSVISGTVRVTLSRPAA